MFKNLFRKNTIKVEFIDAISNEAFGSVKMKPEQLPASFDKPTTIHIENEDWQVERADPVYADEFIKKGELILWVNKILKIDPRNIRFSIPTLSNELPKTADNYLFNGFTHTIHEDDWRQIEFLPVNVLPVVQEEMKMVEEILFPESDPDFDSTVNGFDRVHVRTKIERQLLNIPVEDFIKELSIQQKGNLAIRGYTGYVENGFALRSPGYIYYGTVENGMIKELCLDFFDSMDDEINNTLSKYDLLLINWCRGMISAAM